MRFIQGIILLTFLGTIGIFALQNAEPLNVHFLKWNLTSSLALVLVAVYLLGMLSGWTVVSFFRRSVRNLAARED